MPRGWGGGEKGERGSRWSDAEGVDRSQQSASRARAGRAGTGLRARAASRDARAARTPLSRGTRERVEKARGREAADAPRARRGTPSRSSSRPRSRARSRRRGRRASPSACRRSRRGERSGAEARARRARCTPSYPGRLSRRGQSECASGDTSIATNATLGHIHRTATDRSPESPRRDPSRHLGAGEESRSGGTDRESGMRSLVSHF
jgi:hypothetical protein